MSGRPSDDQLPVRPIERVVETVAIREHDDLARLAGNRQIGEHGHFGRVPVVQVVRRELIVPFELSGVRVEGDD